MHRIPLALLAALVCLGAAGCFRINVTAGSLIPQERIAGIVPGVTTKEEVLRWFGAPASYTDGEIFARMFDAGELAAEDLVALPFADLLVYEIADGRARVLVTILFNWVRVDIRRDRLVIFFDEKDRVLYYGLTRQREGDDEIGGEAPDESEAMEALTPETDEGNRLRPMRPKIKRRQ